MDKDLEKEFLPYELALKMKAIGFNEPCVYYVDKNNNSYIYNFQTHPDEFIEWCGVNVIPTPTFSQAFRWFRKKYDWQTSIIPTRDQHRFEVGYNYWIWNSKNGEEYHTEPKDRPCGDWIFKTNEEAELACLDKLLEIIENKSE
jgi:hypothetical protein